MHLPMASVSFGICSRAGTFGLWQNSMGPFSKVHALCILSVSTHWFYIPRYIFRCFVLVFLYCYFCLVVSQPAGLILGFTLQGRAGVNIVSFTRFLLPLPGLLTLCGCQKHSKDPILWFQIAFMENPDLSYSSWMVLLLWRKGAGFGIYCYFWSNFGPWFPQTCL